MFGGAHTHLVKQVAGSFLQHVFCRSTALIKEWKAPTAWSVPYDAEPTKTGDEVWAG